MQRSNAQFTEDCRACNGTGRRNIADGLSVVECVERLIEEFVPTTTDDELREQVERLRERVERRLQTCHARGICVDCDRDREVLAATAPKEPPK